ncbi:MAG TPA: hypothetical protein PLP12_12575 [Verrucomicrobiota bacterium]|nr:hypothetical protein [Verrucomicrobiota bacterium]
MEHPEAIDDLLTVEPLTDAELDALATADLALEAQDGREPKRQTAGQETGVGQAKRLVTRARRHRTYDLRNVPHAVALIKPLPRRGEVIHAVMGGDFAAWDLVPAILDLAARPADELFIATLGFNGTNNGHLCQLLDQGAIRKAHLLASDYFAKADPSTFKPAQEHLAARGVRLVSARTHAKVIGLAFEPEHFYVIEGSANLRSCNNLEQFTLTNDRDLYRFHQTWIHNIT